MNALTIGVLVATVSVICGSPMPQWHSANGGGSGSRYGNNNNNYQNNKNNNNYQQQYTTAAASGYQQPSYSTQQNNYGYQATQQASYAARPASNNYQSQSYGSSYTYNGPQAQLYQGRYTGSCQADGFYYNDQTSLVFCTNGIAYVQSCAKGSQNSDASQYQVGVDSYVSFCNVNLVDSGAGATSYGGSSSSNSYSGSNNYGNTQRQTYGPIYPQQPTVVAYPSTQSQSYQNQPASYQQQAGY